MKKLIRLSLAAVLAYLIYGLYTGEIRAVAFRNASKPVKDEIDKKERDAGVSNSGE